MDCISKTDILPQAYIYIIYPSNYDVNDNSTRQFYIGSTEDIEKSKIKFYDKLYKGITSKKIQIMRKYMETINKDSIKKDKEEPENRKFWQFRPIFIGFNCCTKSLLKALEGLYIYYYYSIINDKIEFDTDNIEHTHLAYFEYLEIKKHLSKCYAKFEYEDLIYDVNPYTLISRGFNLNNFIHIYKEICERPSMPKFKSTDDLIYQYIITKPINEFYNDLKNEFKNPESKQDKNQDENQDKNSDSEPHPRKKNIYWVKGKTPESKVIYKCYYCDKTYNNVHWWLCDHLEKIHKVKISVKEAREYM